VALFNHNLQVLKSKKLLKKRRRQIEKSINKHLGKGKAAPAITTTPFSHLNVIKEEIDGEQAVNEEESSEESD
jgi:hypothetical protein